MGRRLLTFVLIAAACVNTANAQVRDSSAHPDTNECLVSATPEMRIAACTRAIESGEFDWFLDSAYASRGNARRKSGQFSLAIADFDRAIKIRPSNLGVYIARGHAFVGLNQYQRAFASYDEALERNDRYAPAYNARASTYLKMGKPQLALIEVNRALKANSVFLDAYVLRGDIQLKLGHRDEAISDYRRALRIRRFAPAINRLRSLGVEP